MESLRKSLHEQWAPSRYTIPVNQGQLIQARLTDGALAMPRQPSTNSTLSQTSDDSRRFLKTSSPDSFVNLASSASSEVSPAKKNNVETDARLNADDESPGRISTRLSEDEPHGQEDVVDQHSANWEADATSSTVEVISGDFSSQSTSSSQLTSLDGEETSDQATSHKRCRPKDGQVGERMTPDDTMGKIEDVYGTHDIPQGKGKGRGKRSKARVGDPEETWATATQDEGKNADGGGKVGEGSRCAKAAAGGSMPRIRSSGAPCTPLAFELSSVLDGCREASRLKRQRDLKNASARSFSGKLSGTASAEDPDSKAAACAFSRVLRKVCT